MNKLAPVLYALSTAILLGIVYIIIRLEKLMSTSNQGLQDLQAISDQFAAFAQTVVASLTTLEQELAALQGAPEVTDAQLEAFAQTFASAKAAITAALPATPAPPAPTAGQ